MVLASSDERLAGRFAPYIEELHDFFAGRSVRYGAPEDLIPLAERLTLPGVFHEEMSSLMRAVIYREHESITQADLLGLIAAAVAGPAVDLTAPALRTPVRQLLSFVGGALRSLWRRFPDESSAPDLPARAAPAPTLHSGAATQTPPSRHVFEEVQVRPEAGGQTVPNANEFAERRPDPPTGLFSRIRSLWREADPAVAAAENESYPEYKPVALFQARYRPLWIVGICGASFGLATGLMLRNRPALPRTSVQRLEGTLRPGATSNPQPVYGTEHEPNAIPNPVDTFQADNAALQAAHAALRAANAALPPLPLPPKPTPYGPALDAPAATARSLADPSVNRGGPITRSPDAVSHANAQKLNGYPAPTLSAYRNGNGLSSSSQAPYRTSGPSVGPRFTGPMYGQSRPEPYAEPHSFAMREGQRSTGPAFPRSAPSEQAYLAVPSQPRAERAFPTVPYAREHVFLSATGVMAANLLSAPAPAYPELASSSRVEGKVIVQAVVGTDGSVIATRILSGPQFLRASAESAVRRWRYRPYLVDGRPAVVATDAILNFQLER